MSSSVHEEIDPEIFDALGDIPEKSLISLAIDIASRVLHAESSNGNLVNRICGSYNIVYIIQLDSFKLVIRVPATGWGSGMTPTAAHALGSQVSTIRLIRERTRVPVPEIYSLDTSSNNIISAPYMCMSFLPGKTVSKVWFDDPELLSREELRFRILTSLSLVMARFSGLSFKQIGSVHIDEAGSTFIGPVYDWHENDDGSIRVEASGPYASTFEYIKNHAMLRSEGTPWREGGVEVVNTLLEHSQSLESPHGFVLCPPDFDSQNILVDDQGTVTGIIDWDLAQTMPRAVGYARYPGWITRDWDPLMYGWPHMPDSEDSPEALEHYRAYYNKELGRALGWKDDWAFTEKSHLSEAIWNAALNSQSRLEICRKFVQSALGETSDALGVLLDIGDGYYGEEDWKTLEKKLKGLLGG